MSPPRWNVSLTKVLNIKLSDYRKSGEERNTTKKPTRDQMPRSDGGELRRANGQQHLLKKEREASWIKRVLGSMSTKGNRETSFGS